MLSAGELGLPMSANPRAFSHGLVVVDPRDQQGEDGSIQGEAGRVPTAEDSLRVALLISNAIAAAVYGARGELREQRELPEAGD